MSPDYPDLLFTALWNDDGGLGVFDVRHPARFQLVGRLIAPALARSNRVKLLGTRAFLPLEAEPGGFAIIDVADPRNPSLIHVNTAIAGISTPYTLQPHGAYLYLFGTKEPKMAVLRLDRGDVAEPDGGSARDDRTD